MQVIASKYMNDEGELEALTNSEWAEFGMPTILHRFLLLRTLCPCYALASFPGSPEHEMYTRGEPGIFSHMIMT